MEKKYKAPESNKLASFHKRKHGQFLAASLLGGLWFLPLHMLGQFMHNQGWVTPTFTQTILWCVLPYVMGIVLNYKTIHLPAAERRIVILINTLLPFIILLLYFALFHKEYSRSAIALTFLTTLIWVTIVDYLARKFYTLQLLIFDVKTKEELKELISITNYKCQEKIEYIEWSVDNQSPPECDGVLLSNDLQLTESQMVKLSVLKQMHIRLYSTEAISELLTGKIGKKKLQDILWQPDGNPAYDLVKRMVDVLLIIVTLPLWIIIALVVSVIIKIDTKGPILFSQVRTGQHGKPFKIFKFRSMFSNKDENPKFAEVNDARVTRVGSVLRKTRLDELPQLINVLLGQMSIIGPRPEQYEFVKKFAVLIPNYTYRHLVRPGITGWAQVMQGYAATVEETETKLSYDLYYVKNYSIALDLLIIVKTIKTVIQGNGAR